MTLRVGRVHVDRGVREEEAYELRRGRIRGRGGEVEDSAAEVVARVDVDGERGTQRAGARPGLAAAGAEATARRRRMAAAGGVQQALEGLLVALVEVGMEGGHTAGGAANSDRESW